MDGERATDSRRATCRTNARHRFRVAFETRAERVAGEHRAARGAGDGGRQTRRQGHHGLPSGERAVPSRCSGARARADFERRGSFRRVPFPSSPRALDQDVRAVRALKFISAERRGSEPSLHWGLDSGVLSLVKSFHHDADDTATTDNEMARRRLLRRRAGRAFRRVRGIPDPASRSPRSVARAHGASRRALASYPLPNAPPPPPVSSAS